MDEIALNHRQLEHAQEREGELLVPRRHALSTNAQWVSVSSGRCMANTSSLPDKPREGTVPHAL